MPRYIANRRGVRFAEHVFELGDEIPDSVREQYPEPFRRAIARGKVVEAAEDLVPLDIDTASYAELRQAAKDLELEVTVTSTSGRPSKADFIRALRGED